MSEEAMANDANGQDGNHLFCSETTIENLGVYKEVCHRIRSSLVAGGNEIVSPTTISKLLVKEMKGGEDVVSFSIDGAPSAVSPGGAISHTATEDSCPFLEPAEGWTIEYSAGANCESCGSNTLCVCSHHTPTMELQPLSEAAYREFFYEREHYNYFCEDPDIGPCVLSIKKESSDSYDYRLLLRSSDHYLHGVISSDSLCGEKSLCIDDVVKAVAEKIELSEFKPAQLRDIEKELLRIDETFVKAHHKVGVLRVKEGQRNEEDIFCNCHESGHFDEFLNVLGGRVPLRGFKGFLGGLDSDRDLTGELSVYTKFQELEIMFHVSTLLPFSPKDSQQVNKKRHIGNDIVCVVFLENNKTSFNPSWIRSHFIHCYVVVQHLQGAHGQPLYKVAVARRNNVPSFRPSLRQGDVFAHSNTLQQLLLTKIVNGERASYHAPRFLKLTNRSRGQLLGEITTSLMESSKQGKPSRKMLKRSNWLPIGASRPPSPPLDAVQEKYVNTSKLADDFSIALRGCELADVMFLVGEEKTPLYGVKAVLACRSRVFRTMFKEFKPSSGANRLSSPLLRRRIPTVSSHQYMSPQNQRKSRIPGIGRMKKKRSVPEGLARVNTSESSAMSVAPFCEDPRNLQIKEQYVVEGFTDHVFLEVLNYSMTGSCTINATNVVGIACAAEHYEIEELRQACHQQLPKCLSVGAVCEILGQLEKHLAFSAAKTMIVQCLEFVDSHATELLSSDQILSLSENMVHLVLRRDTDVPEILKVKAAFAWGEVNAKERDGPDFKTLVTPLVKHVRLHLIDAQDMMQILVPSGIFDMDKVMTALAYQVDPQSVEVDDFTMFRPRKKSNVLSSR